MPGYAVAIIISIVVLQYAFALFCLLKLAYLDISRKSYILWNLFILIVFFIGGAAFLIYYFKHPELKIAAVPPPQEREESGRNGEADKSAPSGDTQGAGGIYGEQINVDADDVDDE